MDSVKNSLINFCKGFGIWFLLLLLNTRSGEAEVNGIKTILDIILAIILVSSNGNGKGNALLIAAMTVVVTLLPLSAGFEILMLVGIVILGGVLLKKTPVETVRTHSEEIWNPAGGFAGCTPHFWKSRNFLNPFETYSFSPDRGVNIRKGIIQRSFILIPTTTTRPKIDQRIWQRFLGLCDMSFQNNYTGQQFGEDCMKNIRFRSAMELMEMLQ